MQKSSLWGKAGITIVVLPAGAQGEVLYNVAKEWTALRLLSPSIWVRPEDLVTGDGPPRIDATVLASTRAGESKEKTIDLFKLLALQKLTVLRLLVVRPAVPGTGFDMIQDDFAEILAPYLDNAIPKVPSSTVNSDDDISFVKINLITGPTEHVADQAKEMLDTLFNVHFVPSAEDRTGPRTGDAFVRYSAESPNFAGFTLLHLATLGALWVGIPKGGHQLSASAVWEGDSVYVSRVFVSAILTDGLVRRACARVLETIADSRGSIEDLGVGLTMDGTFPIQDSDVEAWLDFMVGTTFSFDDGILSYQPVLASPTPPKLKLGFGGQLADFFRFAFGKLVRVPHFAWLWLLKKLASLFNQLFQGGDQGSAQVVSPDEGSDPLDKQLLKKFDEVFEVKRLADQALVSPVGRSDLRSTPGLWEGIRKLVFGFMDGSNLAQFGVKKSENGWPVFYQVSASFPDPADKISPELSDMAPTAEFGWGSTQAAQNYVGVLTRRQADAKEQMQTQLAMVVEAQEAISKLEDKLREHAPQLLQPEPAKMSAALEQPSNSLQTADQVLKESESSLDQIDKEQNS
jgi:hypothetical protein